MAPMAIIELVDRDRDAKGAADKARLIEIDEEA
jgi:large subunit ribosomal protein L17